MISHEYIFLSSHHTQFSVNPLGMLGNFMGVQSLQSLQNLPNMPHGDVLEKLKMQVREMKVGMLVSYYRLEMMPFY